MNASDRLRVTKTEIWPIAIPIRDPFVVATGQLTLTQNLFVRITLGNGSQGYGEIAPFPAVSGEDQATSLAAAKKLATVLAGQSAEKYGYIGRLFWEMEPSHPATRCGMETALVDALCRSAGIPLWAWWGGAEVQGRETDITIPITSLERTLTLAHEWYERGFRIFKMKVGKDVDQDVCRLEAIHRMLPDVVYVIDPNQGYSREQAIDFANGVRKHGGTILLFEQPVPRDDLDSLASLRDRLNIPIAVDESVRSLEDAKVVAKCQAADFINIKVTKSGLLETLNIIAYAKASGIRLMIGGMVETRVAMGCSFSLVIGLGGFEVLDLDTPLLLESDPVIGGYQYVGPVLHPWNDLGLGMEAEAIKPCVTIEH